MAAAVAIPDPVPNPAPAAIPAAKPTSSAEVLLSSYLGMGFAVFLAMLPPASVGHVASLQSRNRILSLKLFQAEDALRQLRARRREDARANARVAEILAGHRHAWQQEEKRLLRRISAADDEAAALRSSAAELRSAVERLQREVRERDELLELVVPKSGGAGEGEEEEEDYTGNAFGEMSDAGIYSRHPKEPMPRSSNGWQNIRFASIESTYDVKGFVPRREYPWKVDGESAGVSSKLKLLEQELINLEKIGKGDISKVASSMRKQANRYQSLAGKIDDLCKKMQQGDPCDPTLSPEFRTQRQTEFLFETFCLQHRATEMRRKLTALQAEATGSHLDLLGTSKVGLRRSLDSIRNNFREIQRNLEIWLARIMGDLEGILARDGASPIRDYYLSRYPFVQ